MSSSDLKLVALCILASSFNLTGCKINESVDNRTMSRSSGQAAIGGYNAPPNSTNTDTFNNDDLNLKFTPSPSPTATVSNTPTATLLPTSTVYPQFEYFGSGTIYHYNGSNQLRVNSQVSMTADTTTFTNSAYDSDERQVRDSMAASVGSHIFTRVSPADLRVREREGGFVNDGYLMFARRVLTQKKDALRFSSFLPVFVQPVDKARYRNLILNQPITYAANITGSLNFPIVAKVMKVAESDQEIKIRIDYEISTDTKAQLYERWPLPKTVTYTIDLTNKVIKTMESAGLYFESRNNTARAVNLTTRLCKHTLGSTVTPYTCR